MTTLDDSQIRNVYQEFCAAVDKQAEMRDLLPKHLMQLEPDNVPALVHIICRLGKLAPQLVTNNCDLVQLLVSNLDAPLLNSVIRLIVSKELVLLDSSQHEESLQVLRSSLTWETVESWIFWMIVEAHQINLDVILSFQQHGKFRE